MKPSHILTLGRDAITPSQALVAANAIDADKRVDLEIAARLAANDAQVKADRAAFRARIKKDRDRRRDRGHALLSTWAEYELHEARALGYPPENMLAQQMRKRLEDDGKIVAPERAADYVPLTLIERQSQRSLTGERVERIVRDVSFPMSFRDVVVAVYANRTKQEVAAINLGMGLSDLSACLQLAREHVARQYDDGQLFWNTAK